MEPITLRYTMTAEDVQHGLGVQTKAAAGERRLLLLLLLGIVLLGVVGLVMSRFRLETNGGLVPLALAFVLLIVMGMWTQNRSRRRLAETHGELEATLHDDGVTVVSATSRTESSWAAYGRYVETPQAFVLLAPPPSALIFTTLPKRALVGEADAERLRTLLDRHLPSE